MVSHQGRADRLVPVRVGRMIASPYGFLRGTAVVMAEDVARLPSTGITPVVCGDSHLGNFGFYASPERDLVIDLNDFDEAHPGGWEWDLRRLVASIWVAGRQNGASEEQCGASALSCVAAYREELRRLADQALFSRSFIRLDVDRLAAETAGPLQDRVARSAKRARNRTSDRALPRFTREVDGVRKIVEEPPLITRLPEGEAELLAEALDEYLQTLSPHGRRVLGGYYPGRRRAQGSRGGQCWVASVCGVVGGLLGRGRGVPAAQAGAPVGVGALRARRVGVARTPGPAGSGVPAGATDGKRPAAGLDHDGRAAVLRPAIPEYEGHHPD